MKAILMLQMATERNRVLENQIAEKSIDDLMKKFT